MIERHLYSLSYAVRGHVVLKYFGQLCMVLAVLTFVTLIVSVIFREYSMTLRYLEVIVALLVTGILLNRIKSPSNIQSNEALVVTAFIFIFSSFVLSLPMMASGLSFVDALFEAISAVTTTGLSTLATVEDRPYTFLFSRAWMQWSGGLGIVVLSVALLMRPGVAAKRLVETEEMESFVGGARLYARRVLEVYVILTILGVVTLVLLGVTFFHAVTHTLAGISTGGFSSYNNSLAGIGPWSAQAAVIGISLLGSVSLILYFRAYRKGWRTVKDDVEARALILLSIFIAFLLAVLMPVQNSYPVAETLRHALLLAFSAQTTAGFSSLNVAELDAASKLVLIISMLIGGSIGSTAGGIKLLRLLIVVQLIKLTIIRTCMPAHAVVQPRLAGQMLESDDIERSLTLILMFIITIVVSWLPFVFLGYNPLDALFEVVSATGTVGLSAGITGPDLPSILKGILCADMLLGRLEIVAILVVLYPGAWFGRRVESP